MMRKIVVLALIMAVFSVVPFLALAAPDSPPTFAFIKQLDEPTAVTCTASDTSATRIRDFSLDLQSNAYTIEDCPLAPGGANLANTQTVIRKISSTGSQVWSQAFACGADDCRAHGVGADTDGGVMLAYQNPGSVNTNKLFVTVMSTVDGTSLCSKSGSGTDPFSVDIGGGVSNWQVATRTTNSTTANATIDYFTGGGSGLVAVRRTNTTLCSLLWERGDVGMDAGITYNPVNEGLYVTDSTGCGGANTYNIYRLNPATGATEATSPCLAVSAGDLGGSMAYVNSTGLSVVWPVPATSVTPVLSWNEYDSTTLAQTRSNVAVTEDTIEYLSVQRNTIHLGNDLGNDNSIFACGGLDGVTDGSDSVTFLTKYTALGGTESAQRWNVTFAGNGCRTHIAKDGSLWVSYYKNVDSGQGLSFLRKYSGVATSRETDLPVSFTAVTATTQFPGADGATGFRNFCILTGFESDAGKFFCGLVYVISGTVLMAAVTRDLSPRAVLAVAGATGFGLMIFVTIVELWPTYTTVLMIVLVAAIITFAIKKQFIGNGGE